jgi:hypothetical protein
MNERAEGGERKKILIDLLLFTLDFRNTLPLRPSTLDMRGEK